MAKEGAEIMERGHVFFFYRPRVEDESPSGVDEVQRLYMVLKVGGGRDAGILRLLVLGRKKLPGPSRAGGRGSRPFWGFVEATARDPADLHKALASEEYATATRGERHRPAARAVGQGHYALLKHPTGASSSSGRVHTHLLYSLDLPDMEPPQGSPQEQMNIVPQASFIIQIKNPVQAASSQSRGVPARRTDPFPAALQDKMGSLRWAPCEPPDFLNQEGCEFLLIAASDDIAAEFEAEIEGEVDHECQELAGGDPTIFSLLEDSEAEQDRLVQPLFEAKWV